MASFRLGSSRPARSGPLPTALRRVGGTVFFGLFLAAGVFFGVMLARQAAEQLAPHGWAEQPAVVTRSEVVRRGGEKPYVPVVAFEYEWNGRPRTSHDLTPDEPGRGSYGEAAARIAPYPVGARVTCRVAPGGLAVLEPGRAWSLLLVALLPLAFAAIGLGGLYGSWRPVRRDASGRPRQAPISAGASGRHGTRAMLVVGGLFVVVGAAIAWPTALRPALSIWQARGWTPTRCHVEHSSVRAHEGDDGTTYSVDILYRFEQGGRTHRSSRYSFFGGSSSGRAGKEAIVRAHPAGGTVTCFVDPDTPGEAVIERGPTLHALVGLIPLAFVGLGLLVMQMARRRHARREQLTRMLAAGGRGPAPDDPVLEWLPDFVPGATPTVLPPESTRTGRLLGIVFACVFWNGIVSVFLHQVAQSFERGRPEWGLALFLVPFVLVGVGLFVAILYTLLALSNARPVLEANAAALALGETLEVAWRMRGRLSGLRRLTIVLEGVEQATYRRGTNSYTVRETFASTTLVDVSETWAMASGRATVAIARDAMHSFAAGNNVIAWSLHLKGVMHRWPDIDERYPIVVLPVPLDEIDKAEDRPWKTS